MIITREATLNDLPALDNLLQKLVDTERAFDETMRPGKIIYYDLKDLIEKEESVLMVLEENDTIVGCGYAQIRKAKPYYIYEDYAYLGFMYILPVYRGKGLNQQLIITIKNWALSKGITEMQLEVYEGNTGAIKAYEKAGFKKILSTMRCGISS